MNIRKIVVSPYTPRKVVLPLVFLVLAQLVAQAGASHVFEAYRVAQFDKGTQQFGSRRTIVNHLATTIPAGEAKPQDMARKIPVVSIRDLTVESLTELVDKRGPVGLLITLPSEQEIAQASAADIESWKALEDFLVSREFQLPIYFAFENEDLTALINRIQADPTGVKDRYQMVVSGSEGSAIPTVVVNNYHGWHHSAPAASSTAGGSGSDGEAGSTAATLAIVADYDTFAAAPALAMGVSRNGSGAVALLELVRLFGRLYGEFRSHGKYNLLFILAGAARLNHAGIKQWLKTIDARVVESIEFALCLDSIPSNDHLYLHVSKSAAKSPQAATIYSTFAETAKSMNIPFDIVHRKINISSPVTNWAHEQFSRKHILAGTLSNFAQPPSSSLLASSSMFDRRSGVNASSLVRNIQFIAEALSRRIYGISASKQLQIFEQSQGVSEEFVSSWLNFFGVSPRMVAHMGKGNEVISELDRFFSSVTADFKKSSFPLDSSFKFYTSIQEQIAVYNVKPVTFDIVYLLLVFLYLGALYAGIKYLTNPKELWSTFSFKSSAPATSPAPVSTGLKVKKAKL